MLKSHHWSQHSLYQNNLINSLKSLYDSYKDRIDEYSELIINKLFYLNLDNTYESLAPIALTPTTYLISVLFITSIF